MQVAFFTWAQIMGNGERPALALAYHIPNGGARDAKTGARLKREGVKAGVPDIHLPVPRGGYASLYIELKKPGGKPRPNQLAWINQLRDAGNRVEVCDNLDDAIAATERYLEGWIPCNPEDNSNGK